MTKTVAKTQLRESFFEFLFGEQRGYLCLAVAERGNPEKMRSSFRRIFFEWPLAKKELKSFIDDNIGTKHLWFSVHLFNRAKALKENAVGGRLVYADLDTCDPNEVDPKPSIATETSPGHFHAIWRLNTNIPPSTAADYSRRIAYKYSINGADKSGWDIGQLLRIPYTRNYKYPHEPEVDVLFTSADRFAAQTFEDIEKPSIPESSEDADDSSMPSLDELPDPETIMYKYANEIRRTNVMEWYLTEPSPGDDWSGIMWRMTNTLLEIGLSPEETFAVVATAKCNKYERDRRPIRLLWKEVLKANRGQTKLDQLMDEHGVLEVPELAKEPASETILDLYQDWATDATDAVPVFHELAGFMVLSAVLSPNLRLETNYGSTIPNLWGLVLGESTLTRKTTAMNLARKLLQYLDETIEIGSEGSVEGMLQELSTRPRVASLFYRDEVSGFFNAITKKEYLSGMIETLTHLYDCPTIFRRMLKREIINVNDPVFLFFGGGVTEELFFTLNSYHITSGFLPRFLIVSGKSEPSMLRPTAPFSNENMNKRTKVYDAMGEIYHTYNQTQAVRIGNQTIQKQPMFQVELSNEAWSIYQKIEGKLTKAAYDSNVANLALPTFGRLSQSCLKMGMLLAASRQEPQGDTVICNEQDITNAAYYVQKWGRNSVAMVYDAGKTASIRTIEQVRQYIIEHPASAHSTLMRRFNLRKREMDEVIDTLLDRGEIRKQKKDGKGGGSIYWPM